MRLGETIKSHRKKSGWTLTELSDLCEISVAQLSKLENNKSNPSIESLQKLAEAFHVPVSALTLTTEVPPPAPVMCGEGYVVRVLARGEENVTARYLVQDQRFRMQPMVLTIPPRMMTEDKRSHVSDEFFYVLKGKVRFVYCPDLIYEMNEGDFLYYDAVVAHHWENPSDEESRLLLFSASAAM